MTATEDGYASGRARRILAGATILQAVPALNDDRIGRSALDLAHAQLRSGARAIIAGGGGRLVGELQAAGGEWMDVSFTTGLLKRRRGLQALNDLLAAERVELVHAHGAEIARHALAAAKRSAIPLVATYYGLPPRRPSRAFRTDPLAQADAILAPSEFAADLIARHHGVAPERIGVIPPTIDTAWFDPAAVSGDRIVALRQAWQIHPDARIVLAAGRFAPGNGQLTLVDAARILVNGGLRDVIFVVVGDPADGSGDDYRRALEARITAQGLGAMFVWVGHCSDMPAAYAAAELVVLPAERATAFEESAADAQAMARPVVASNIGALAEIVLGPPRVPAENRTGWLARPRDPLNLAGALAAALTIDAELWHRLGNRARELAERRFSQARVTETTLAVYGALLEGGG
jgi:glycosyltransferase involved in cell wall biosynthesis